MGLWSGLLAAVESLSYPGELPSYQITNHTIILPELSESINSNLIGYDNFLRSLYYEIT